MPEPKIPAYPAAPIERKDTAFSVKSIIQITPEDNGAAATVFATDELTMSVKNETKTLEFPGEDGVLTVIRKEQTKREETYAFKAKNPAKVMALFGGTNKLIDAKVRIWRIDPKDAPGTCRAASEEFPASVEIDGDTKAGGGDFESWGIKLTSLKPSGAVEWYWQPALTPAA